MDCLKFTRTHADPTPAVSNDDSLPRRTQVLTIVNTCMDAVSMGDQNYYDAHADQRTCVSCHIL